MKVYIAGPITGHFDYRAKFRDAEKELQEKGHIVVNPATLPDGLGDLGDYLRICFAMIDSCEAIYFLSGWTDSKGANEEWEYANEKGKKMFYQSEEDEREWENIMT